jgi:uncharacterized protein YcaQ
MRKVSLEQARRIAVRAQLLDGSATDVLSTVRHLGFLQLDPIATVARPQHLVLWSRLGPFDTGELDRLLWDERKLFEFDAFIYPIESLPLIRARMKRYRTKIENTWDQRRRDFVRDNASFRRYILRELERSGPMLSRDLEDRSKDPQLERHPWYGTRYVGRMLETLHVYGEVAVAGRRGGQRLWDIAERYLPESETMTWAAATRATTEQQLRSLGVRLVKGEWHAHPDASDEPVPDRVTLLSPFDRLIHDRKRLEALFGMRYRLEMYVPPDKREFGYYVLPLLSGDQIVGRAEPRFDRKTKMLEILGAWGDTERLDEALAEMAVWLGAEDITGVKKQSAKKR